MPKVKTLKGAKKRFKKIASGQFKHKRAYSRHILTKKTTKHKRFLRKKVVLSNIYTNIIRKHLPYI